MKTIFLAIGLILITACSTTSPTPNYYLLETKLTAKERANQRVIGFGPVEIAGYLDKPQLAIRGSDNQVEFAEFHRWASNLRGLIIDTLQYDLSNELDTDFILTYPWRKSDEVDFALIINIQRFDGKFAASGQLHSAYLEASVKITSKEGVYKFETYSLSETFHDATYNSLVSAQRKLLLKLSQSLANRLKQLE